MTHEIPQEAIDKAAKRIAEQHRGAMQLVSFSESPKYLTWMDYVNDAEAAIQAAIESGYVVVASEADKLCQAIGLLRALRGNPEHLSEPALKQITDVLLQIDDENPPTKGDK